MCSKDSLPRGCTPSGRAEDFSRQRDTMFEDQAGNSPNLEVKGITFDYQIMDAHILVLGVLNTFQL